MNQPDHSKPKRPFWIWLISAFYLYSGTMSLSLYYYIQAGIIALPPGHLTAINRLTLWGLIPIANLAAAILLFMRRKAAFYIFSAMLVMGGINTLILFFTIDWSARPVSGQDISRLVFGYAITLVVCFYTFRLKQNGTLK